MTLILLFRNVTFDFVREIIFALCTQLISNKCQRLVVANVVSAYCVSHVHFWYMGYGVWRQPPLLWDRQNGFLPTYMSLTLFARGGDSQIKLQRALCVVTGIRVAEASPSITLSRGSITSR